MILKVLRKIAYFLPIHHQFQDNMVQVYVEKLNDKMYTNINSSSALELSW